ncbi:MAG: OmpA family protein [Planctomycetota bacterium]|jgi:chemotaxis protein MotB
MMQTIKLSRLIIICACAVLVLSGCTPEKELKIQNEAQRKRIAELESQKKTATLKLEQMQRRLATAKNTNSVEVDSLQQSIKALEEDLEKKKTLISSMQQQLLSGGFALPVELSSMLEDFAKGQEMITFDSKRGLIKFKSDLLFQPGSDTVTSSAAGAVGKLCNILNSQQGGRFDVIIAGHTDDVPIGKPETRAKHPTNWHLSAHRAIAVLNTMSKNKLAEKRMSIRGFGEYRSIEKNKPNKKGNPKNRRVEIYIVPEGM